MERSAGETTRHGRAAWRSRAPGVANGVLFVALAALVGWQASGDRARHDAARAPAPRSGVITYAVRDGTVSPEWGVQIEFSRDVVGPDAVGAAAPDGLVRFEPDVPIGARWLSRSLLRVDPEGALPRARRIHVHVDTALLAPEGGDVVLAPPTPAWFDTDPVRVLAAVGSAHDDSGTAREIVVSCDLGVPQAAFAKAVTVHGIDERGEAGAALAVRVEALDAPGEHAWRLTLLDADVPDAVIVRVDGALAPDGADVALGRTWERTIVLRPELFVTAVRTRSDGLGIELNHEVPLPLAGTLTIDPPVDFQVHRRWDELRLFGDFRPGAAYRVTLHEGFPGTGPVRLRATVERSVRLPDLDPSISFADAGSVLSSRARHEIAVDCVNVRRLEVAARSVYANNVVRLAQSAGARDLPDVVFGPWARREIAVAAARNERATERIALDELFAQHDGGSVLGLHEIRVRDLDGEARTTRRVVQITDLGTTVRATRDALALRVMSIAHACPVAGAEVVVHTPTNQVLCTGTTAEDGTALLRYGARDDDRVPYLVEVRTATDRTVVDLDGFEVVLAEEAQSGRPYVVGGFECDVHPDRGAVRPGETARVTIVGRSARGVSPVGAEVEARWHGPDGGQRRAERLRFGDAGLLVAAHTTSRADRTGTWRVDVVDAKTDTVVGRARFLVEAFVPDRLEASVEMVGTPRLGAPVRLRVRAAWLEGAPAAGQAFRATVRLDHATWHPEGLEDHSFGAISEGDAEAPPGELPAVRGVLGANGTAEIAVALPDAAATGLQACHATVRVEVSDPSGRPVRAGLQTDVLRNGPLLGARAAAGALDVVLVDPEGRPHTATATAQVTLERRIWRWRPTRSRGSDGRTRRRWEPYVEAEPAGRLTADVTDGHATLALPEMPEHGDWIVAVVHVDVDGTTLRADAPLGAIASRPDRLRVEGPAGVVRAGDEIELSVASPTAGQAFVTFESTTVHAVTTATVARGRDAIRVVVPDDVEGPNVHAVVTIVAPQARADATPPYWIVGATSLDVVHDEREAEVSIDAPQVVLPGADVELLVDAPGATHATVALVDEGALRVTGHPDPDPVAFFRARRRLETRGADTGSQLMERPGFDPDVLDGGDQDARAALAERLQASTSAVIETVALFAGPVTLDPEGRVRVTFSLPEYEGRLRAMVIAAGPSRVGAASVPVTVRAPLGLRVAAPRRLAPGDVSTATITVRNGTGTEAPVDVSVTVSDGLELHADAERRLVLADGASISFDVDVAATSAAATAEITVRAACGDERRTVGAAVPVRPAGLFESQRVGLRLAPDAEVRIPGSWAAGSRSARLVIAPGVGADLLPALEALLGYPHGCVEQTSSRAHAVLACRPLLEALDPETAARAGDMVAQGIARLRAMQTPRGGMAFWPGGRTEVDLGSVVALDFLLDARDQGFDVDARSLERLARRVEHRVAQWDDPSFRAMAVEILSRGGAAIGPWLPGLANAVERAEDRARVALAFARIGDVASATTLLANPAGGDDATAETGGLLFSPTRERAFLLRALLEIAPGDERIDVLADALRADVLDPGRLTTQSQSHAVRALAALHLRDLRTPSDVRGVVLVDGVEHAVDGRTVIAIPADGEGVVRCALTGATRALLEVRGIRTDTAPADEDGAFRVSRRLIDLDTGKPASRLRRGGAYEVVLDVHVAERASNVLLTDVLPAGLEAESPRLGAAARRADGERLADHVDVRDDRVLLHLDGPVDGAFNVRYRAHAVFPGRYTAPPPMVEALYAPGSLVRGRGADGLEIVR